MKKRVVIIGAGASGIMAAISAAEDGCLVTLIDGNNKVGKKLYATGNGRCNFTNLNMKEECFRSDSLTGFYSVIERFDEKALIDYFYKLGINHKDRNGYVYPANDQAQAVVFALNKRLSRLKVDIKLEEKCSDIILPDSKNNYYEVVTEKAKYKADAVVVSTGLKASPNSGSDGKFLSVIKNLHLKINPVTPALVPLIFEENDLSDARGVRCNGKISLYVDGQYICCDTGELQFNKKNISGIPTFQVSRYASKALNERKSVKAVVDFYPSLSRKDLIKQFKEKQTYLGYETVYDILFGFLNAKICDVILKRNGFDKNVRFDSFSQSDLERLAIAVKEFVVTIKDTAGFEYAQVCAGGIDLSEIDISTMESVKYKGLYFCGEILDVDGICGGYNLQWAFAGGYLAGKAIAKGE